MTTQISGAKQSGGGAQMDGPTGTGSRSTLIIGALALLGLAVLVLLAFWVTPEDEVQGNLVRLIYVHPPAATVAYLGCILTTAGSIVFLWKRSMWWDLVAGASAEIAAVFTAITLVTGMLWGRPSWGVYWVWDARLTSTAILMLLLLGYLAVRRLPGDHDLRATRAAWIGLLLVPNVILVRQSVQWWRTLHQAPTLTLPGAEIHGLQLFTMMVGFLVFTLVFLWLLIHRFRVGWLEEQVESQGLEVAIDERRLEAGLGARTDQGGEPWNDTTREADR